MSGFTVIVTALDETWSLRQTVDEVIADNRDRLTEIIVAIAPHTTAACRAVLAETEAAYPALVRHHQQNRLPGVGGAIIECAEQARGAWTIIMAADLETPPETVRALITGADAGAGDIVATSRWIAGGGFGNYSRPKLVCNWIFQKFFSFLYATRLTDMTYGYRAYRTELLTGYHWRETGQAFFLESLCRALLDGKKVVEIPVRWQRRQEGESHIKTAEFARYFRTGFAVRLTPRQRLNSHARAATGKESAWPRSR